jgi:hypothetical protein
VPQPSTLEAVMAPPHQSSLMPVPVQSPSPAESLDPAEPAPASRMSGRALRHWFTTAMDRWKPLGLLPPLTSDGLHASGPILVHQN